MLDVLLRMRLRLARVSADVSGSGHPAEGWPDAPDAVKIREP